MITPIEKVNGIYVKRNDKYLIGGCNGGKAASAYQILLDAKNDGYVGAVTTGSRFSPQCEIVSNLCEMLDMQCILVMPSGPDTKVLTNIRKNKNSTIVHPKCAYQNVLNHHATLIAEDREYCLVPFGMQCEKNVHLIAKQCENIPKEVKRIVMPVGSGMSFVGVLQGLIDFGRTDIKLVGVQTGGNPEKIIQKFLPKAANMPDWKLKVFMPDATPSKRYDTKVSESIGDIKLDPIYEGKCKGFLEDGDLFWIVGIHEL